MKRLTIVLLAALFLAGCSRETQVWLPEEEVVELQGQDVVRIPMGKETEPTPTEPTQPPTEETEPAETQPVMTEKATITKKPAATSKKNTTTGTTKKETITATGKPVSTEPPATEPDKSPSGDNSWLTLPIAIIVLLAVAEVLVILRLRKIRKLQKAAKAAADEKLPDDDSPLEYV